MKFHYFLKFLTSSKYFYKTPNFFILFQFFDDVFTIFENFFISKFNKLNKIN